MQDKYIAIGIFILVVTASILLNRFLYHRRLRRRPEKRKAYQDMLDITQNADPSMTMAEAMKKVMPDCKDD